MGRRVETGGAAAGSAGTIPEADDYFGRLVKYIPAEIVGLWLVARGMIPAADAPVLWATFGGAWLLVPVYLWFATSRRGRPLPSQIVLAAVAFPVWVFAIGGPFPELFAWHRDRPYAASIVLLFITVVFPLYRPLDRAVSSR
jgi:hypothetical protein